MNKTIKVSFGSIFQAGTIASIGYKTDDFVVVGANSYEKGKPYDWRDMPVINWTENPLYALEALGRKISRPRTRAGYDILGWEPDEFRGTGIQRMVNQEDSQKLFDLALKSGWARGEVRNYVKDTGQVILYDVAIVRHIENDDRIFHVVFFPHDMRKETLDILKSKTDGAH